MSPLRLQGARPRRGSVLVPAVAALLVLLLLGSALADLGAAQALEGGLAAESARAYWIAEAGLEHAALAGTALAGPIVFAGGSYRVAASGAEWSATGTRGAATRVLRRSFRPRAGPLDEAASVASAEVRGNRMFELELVSRVAFDVQLASFALSADLSTPRLERVRLEGSDVWRSTGGVALPTGTLLPNEGTPAERTLVAGSRTRLRVHFASNLSGARTFTLVLAFTDGSSSTLVFRLVW